MSNYTDKDNMGLFGGLLKNMIIFFDIENYVFLAIQLGLEMPNMYCMIYEEPLIKRQW